MTILGILGVLAAVALIILSTVRESWSAQRVSVGATDQQRGMRIPRWVDLALLALALSLLLPRFWGLLT